MLQIFYVSLLDSYEINYHGVMCQNSFHNPGDDVFNCREEGKQMVHQSESGAENQIIRYPVVRDSSLRSVQRYSRSYEPSV